MILYRHLRGFYSLMATEKKLFKKKLVLDQNFGQIRRITVLLSPDAHIKQLFMQVFVLSTNINLS